MISGTPYGPVLHSVTPERVAAFVAATGDDPDRWRDHAPPSYAAVGLIAVAADLLAEATSAFAGVVHTKQRFEFDGPLAVDATVEIGGEVTSLRERKGMTLVDFIATASGWMRSESSFLMSVEAPEPGDELVEPPPLDREGNDLPTPAADLPDRDAELAPFNKSASRLDLVRYAAASGDWNPIHWDHGSAVAAGLGGVVAHGLLAASWVAQAACRYSTRPAPLDYLEVRFRRPLRPAAAARVVGTVLDVAPLQLKLDVVAGAESLVTATAGVTP